MNKFFKHILRVLVIVFLSIFMANLTRKLEISNSKIKSDLHKEIEQLSINKIEFTFYNNSDYLKKIYSLYFSFEEEGLEKKVVLLSDISNNDKNSLIFANLETK